MSSNTIKIFATTTLILSGKSLFACCGCAIVIASMNALTAGTKGAIKEADETLGMYFKQQVVAENERYLKSLKNTKEVVENSTKLNKGMFLEYDKINFVIQKEALVNSVKKD